MILRKRTLTLMSVLVLFTMLFAVSAPVQAKKDKGTGDLLTMSQATGSGEIVALFRNRKPIWQPVVDVSTTYYADFGALPWVEIEGAVWISYDFEAFAPSDNSWYVYKKSFEIPGEVVSASMFITVDNAYMLHVNGRLVGRDGNLYQPSPETDPKNWQSVEEYDVTKALREGENKVVVYVRNYGMADGTWENNPTGLIFRIDITYIG
jgi:hypothetical protein